MSRPPLALVCLALLLLASPAAVAQGFELSLHKLEGLDDPIKPVAGSASMRVPWTVSCMGNVGTPLRPTGTVSWEVEAPPGIDITGPSQGTVPLPACHDKDSVSGESRFDVRVDETVPGLEDITVRVAATLTWEDAHPFVQPSSRAMSQDRIQADYVGIISVDAPDRIQQAAPGDASEVRISVTNLGNARTVVRFTEQNEQGGERIGRIVAPPRLVLEAGASGEGIMRYQHEGEHLSEQAFVVQVVPHAAQDDNKTGQAVEVPLLFVTRIDSRSETTEVPAPPIVAMAPLLLGLASVAFVRRRKGLKA